MSWLYDDAALFPTQAQAATAETPAAPAAPDANTDFERFHETIEPLAPEIASAPIVDTGLKTIIVKNLQWWTSENDLRALLSSCGVISGIDFEAAVKNGKSLGVAMITFQSSDAALRAVVALHNRPVNGKPAQAKLMRASNVPDAAPASPVKSPIKEAPRSKPPVRKSPVPRHRSPARDGRHRRDGDRPSLGQERDDRAAREREHRRERDEKARREREEQARREKERHDRVKRERERNDHAKRERDREDHARREREREDYATRERDRDREERSRRERDDQTALSVVTIYVQIVATVTIDPDAHGTDPNSADEANHLEVVGSVLHLSRGQIGLVRSVGALHLGAAMGDATAMGAATMA
ncbi:unnamed protein product (mitochondrion) [Plasmodiophora brassicae]|uniref:RRM domain-containing protein n=1 Tax=Plasmodiophora brassicae TaxID=37360 RepID=A0A3P3Y6F0_PLABS|nr:unnamed protein product [Plasmodiophora brassicae]